MASCARSHKLTKAQLSSQPSVRWRLNQQRPSDLRRSLVVSHRPDAPNVVQARAESSLLEQCRAQPTFNLLKSAARVTYSRPQLPSWGFANLLAKTYTQRLRFSDRPSGGAPAGKLGPTSCAAKMSENVVASRRPDGVIKSAKLAAT